MEEVYVTAPSLGDDYMIFMNDFQFIWAGVNLQLDSYYDALGNAFVGEAGVYRYESPKMPAIIINENDFDPDEIGTIRKIFMEAWESPRLSEAFARLKANGNTIKIYNDGLIHNYNGTTQNFTGNNSDTYGFTSKLMYGDWAKKGTTIYISLNDAKHGNLKDFTDTVVHELMHQFFAGNSNSEEDKVKTAAPQVVKEIFKTNGVTESDIDSYYDASTAQGTEGNDLIIGTSDFDILAGNDGRDTIKGLGGDDYLFGEGGSDILIGGGGDDVLVSGAADIATASPSSNEIMKGGSGDDLYIVQSYASKTVINDFSGDDSLKFDHDRHLYNFYDVSEDTMIFFGAVTYGYVYVEDWSEDGLIENITLSDGTDYVVTDTVI